MPLDTAEFPLVTELDEVNDNIRVAAKLIKPGGALDYTTSYIKAYYTMDPEAESPLFGFSKFVGYANPTSNWYLNNYRSITGSDTEKVLKKWFAPVSPDDPLYKRLHGKLSIAIGRSPQKNVRICVLKNEFRRFKPAATDDRSLLELLIRVAKMMPLDHQSDLKASLG